MSTNNVEDLQSIKMVQAMWMVMGAADDLYIKEEQNVIFISYFISIICSVGGSFLLPSQCFTEFSSSSFPLTIKRVTQQHVARRASTAAKNKVMCGMVELISARGDISGRISVHCISPTVQS